MGGPNDMARDATGNLLSVRAGDRRGKPAISVRDGNGAVLARWEITPTHGMGIDAAAYLRRPDKMARVDKYVRMH